MCKIPPKILAPRNPLFLCAIASALSIGSAWSGDVFFSVPVRSENATFPQLIPLPDPDATGHSPNDPAMYTMWSSRSTAGKPNALYLESSTATSSSTVLSNLAAMPAPQPTLQFCHMDFEGKVGDPLFANVARVSAVVHSSTLSANALVGNYAFYPGATDTSAPYPSSSDRSAYDAFYNSGTSGLNIAEPNCYIYSYYMQHTSGYTWGTNIAPNMRSALFWAPLEKLSVAKRSLPAGHLLLPFTCAFVAEGGYNAVPLSQDDTMVLMQHFRMRGANGFIQWRCSYIEPAVTGTDPRPAGVIPAGSWVYPSTDGGTYTNDMNLEDSFDAWGQLDDVFDGSLVKSFLNLATSKTTGLQWSGVRNGDLVTTLVSNLGNSGTSASYPGGWGDLPAASDVVTTGTHQFFNYIISDLASNPNFTTNAGGWYLNSGAATWSGTNGVDNGPCLKLTGGFYSVMQTAKMNTEKGAAMSLFVSVKRTTATGRLGVSCYYYDGAGTQTGTSSGYLLDTGTSMTTTMQTFKANFTTPTNIEVKSMALIFYNVNATTDVLYVDNVVVNFGNLIANPSLTANSAGWYFNPGAASWSATGGTGNSPCLKLTGGTYAVLQSPRVLVAPNTPMKISVAAKCGSASGRLGIRYYYYDAAGTVLGTSGYILDTGSSLTSTMQTYSGDFTVSSNPSVAAIALILYNVTSPSDILYVDDLVVEPR